MRMKNKCVLKGLKVWNMHIFKPFNIYVSGNMGEITIKIYSLIRKNLKVVAYRRESTK